MLFDTHAHLDDEQLADVASEVIEDARAHDVNNVLTVSTTLASCYRSVRLCETFSEVWAAVGIHPNSC
ncbi:MAG: TatD family hydrolase, partial [Pirellulaceae bacterium]